MKKRKNQRYVELEIESIGFEGKAVARKDNIVHFVRGAVPKDKVVARVLRKKKRWVECQAVEILEAAPERIEPRCRHFGDCGGCKWQHLKYDEQLRWKRVNVVDAFERIAGLKGIDIFETMPSPRQFHYRNKMEFSFSHARWLTEEEISSGETIENKDFALGLHPPNMFDKTIDVEKCHIAVEEAAAIMNDIRKAAIAIGARPYNQKSHEGFLRNLVLRNSIANKELMVNLITTAAKTSQDEEFLRFFEGEFAENRPEISCLIHSVSDKIAQVAVGKPRIIKGLGYIAEAVLGVEFRVSPYSFFQTNSYQLDGFISEILDFASISPADIVWDLYCGAGSISLPAAKRANCVYGIELSESAVDDANANKDLNNIKNAKFYRADLHEKTAPDLLETLPSPDIIIIDPPRAGMHKNLVSHILSIKCPKIVYVSCNPATQARDCKILSENYQILKILPADMFPHTFHIESIALLELKNGK